LQIKGFQGTSLLDFPGRIAALVFTGGCNLRCAFCHNPGLVLEPDQYPTFPEDELLAELERRRNFIDGVVVSGGEPTLAAGLDAFLLEVKQLGLQVKLDTNGLQPQVIATLLERHLIDYLAVDLKTAPSRYAELHAAEVDTQALLETCRLVMAEAPDYEFRTTCVPGYVAGPDILAIGGAIQGAKHWVLQQYVPREVMLGQAPAAPYPASEFECLRQLAAVHVLRVSGRGW
jgi:pyruvate formate lyase activating enzyme